MAPVNLTNRTIAGYRCTTRIAAGATGTVWKAQNLEGRVVAIKLINAQLARSRQEQAIFLNEYRLCRQFSHQGLLEYYDRGVFEGVPYLIMEYFHGSKLRDCITGGTPCTVTGYGREILIGVARALAYIHDRGIVHCDVKPENILVNSKGEIRLIDFSAAVTGLAKWFPFLRKIQGTPTYMAPEQIRKRRVTPAIDMYALGATAYEMFTGRPPFVGDNRNQVLGRHLQVAPKPLTDINRNLTREFSDLVVSMLAKQAHQRPLDMRSMLRMLKRISIYRHEEAPLA